jgi:hypothetical protein
MPANLTVHMSALRRTLRDGRDGNRFIINVPGRGYSFVASVAVAGRANQMATRPRRAVRATLSTVRRRLVGLGSAALKLYCESSDGKFEGHGNDRDSNRSCASTNRGDATRA